MAARDGDDPAPPPPAYRLPDALEVVGVDGRTPPPPSGSTRAPSQLDVRNRPPGDLPALELDHQPPPAAAPLETTRVRPGRLLLWIGLLAMLSAGGAVAWVVLARPGNVEIDLVMVPPGARLSIDGASITGHHLVVPRGEQLHRITVRTSGGAQRVIAFRPTRDAVIDVTEGTVTP